MPFFSKKRTRIQERIFEEVPVNPDWNFPSKQEELSNLEETLLSVIAWYKIQLP